jgi:hypothetical protein
VTDGLRPHSANLHPFIIDIQPPLLNWLSCLPLTLICFRSFSITVSAFSSSVSSSGLLRTFSDA